MKVLVAFGTRPEAIKLAPVIAELQRRRAIDVTVALTAQHRELLDQVLRVFAITPDVDLALMQPSQALASLTSRVILAMDQLLDERQPDLTIVQGDTTSAFACALASFYRGVPVEGYGWLVTSEGGFFRSAVGQVLPGLSVDTNPALTGAAAVNAAIAKLALPSLPWQGAGAPLPTAELVLKPQGLNPAVPEARLLWRVSFSGIDVEHDFGVARDGHRVARPRHLAVRPRGRVGPAHCPERRGPRLHRSVRCRVAMGMVLGGGDATGAQQERYAKKARIEPGPAHDRHPLRRDSCTPPVILILSNLCPE